MPCTRASQSSTISFPRNSRTRTEAHRRVFEKVAAAVDEKGRRPSSRPESPTSFRVRRRAGRDRAGERLPLDRADLGIEFDRGTCPASTRRPSSRRCRSVFFGGDAAFGPKNIIWAVAHGHDAAISIDRYCRSERSRTVHRRASTSSPRRWASTSGPTTTPTSTTQRYKVRPSQADRAEGRQGRGRTGLRPRAGLRGRQRCLNCDADGVRRHAVHRMRCLHRYCPMDCITFTGERRRREESARG